MKKFCCDRFKGNYETVTDREVYPSIKIVKLSADSFNQGKNLYRFYFVCGFMKDKPPVINVRFCPFCGTNLFYYYKSDSYINGSYSDFEIGLDANRDRMEGDHASSFAPISELTTGEFQPNTVADRENQQIEN